jgi:hypothetical protein
MQPMSSFPIKGFKSDNFADKYPSFLWYLLICNLSEYFGEDLWRMIPSTMHPWWFSSLIQPGQDWSRVYTPNIPVTTATNIQQSHNWPYCIAQ